MLLSKSIVANQMSFLQKAFLKRSTATAALLIVFAASPALAQMRIGLIGGLSFSSLSEINADNALVEFGNKNAFHAGIFLDFPVGALSIRPTALYLNTGPLFEGAPFLIRDTFNMVYIAVPLDLVYTLDTGAFKPYFFAGPELRLLNSGEAPVDIKEDFKQIVANATAGVGVEFKIPGTSMTLMPHLRYSFGLSEITEKTYTVGDVTVQTDGNAKVNSWLLSLGLVF